MDDPEPSATVGSPADTTRPVRDGTTAQASSVDEGGPAAQLGADAGNGWVGGAGTVDKVASTQVAADDGGLRRAGRRVANAATTARDASISALITTLTPVVRTVGVLLLGLSAWLVVPAALLIIVAWWRPSASDWFPTVLAVVGLAVAGWMARRRRQLLATVADRQRLTTALLRVLRGRDIADRITGNLTGSGARMAGRAARGAVRGGRGLRLLRGMWHGIAVTGVIDELLGADEIAPLLPGRIRGLGILAVVAAVLGLVLWVGLAIATLAFLAGA